MDDVVVGVTEKDIECAKLYVYCFRESLLPIKLYNYVTNSVWDSGVLPKKKILIEFISNNCPYCHKNDVNFQKLASELSSRAYFVEMTRDSSSMAAQWISAHHTTTPLLADDGKYFSALGVKNIPATIILSEDGAVIYRYVGVWTSGVENEIKYILGVR